MRIVVDTSVVIAVIADEDAYILQCAIEYELPLMSLDKNLVDVARKEGIQVVEVIL